MHGGEHKAVYAYAWEDTLWWQEELGRELEPGNFGENLTLSGVDVPEAVVGERWRVGSALLEVSEPRFPCFKLGLRMGDPTVREALRRGAAHRDVPADRGGRVTWAPATAIELRRRDPTTA